MPLTYISLCSGIEAASVAFTPLGWTSIAFSEIEPFPSKLLNHHYPSIPNHGDFTKFDWSIYQGSVDVLVAGTPCQAFSVAGLRNSLADARGNLTLEFIRAANAIRPKYIIWENVPGVLSTKDNAFGCFLAGLVGSAETISLNKRWSNAGVVHGPARRAAWRVLDAQYFGLAQQRKRVFVVASAGDGRDPAQVLFEWEGLQRNSAPSRSPEEEASPNFAQLFNAEGSVGATLTASNIGKHLNNQTPLVVHGTQDPCIIDIAFSLQRNGGRENVLVFDPTQITSPYNKSNPKPGDPCHTLSKTTHPPVITHKFTVRRLTPIECERLQGFPDNYTLISPNTKDTPRYKAIGNSMAVPVMRWIGERILNAR